MSCPSTTIIPPTPRKLTPQNKPCAIPPRRHLPFQVDRFYAFEIVRHLD
jgi:hypothetical protein